MFKSAKRKKSHGFTLAEVLIVVAIIGILLAVAIPNVISYYRSLKLTELDDSARSIFVAAQNRLTAMKSAGANLNALSTVEVNEKPDPGVGTGRFLAVTSAQADSLASLVPGGSIESQLHDNHYVVEIDAKTGAVYAVWYWEKENFDYVNESYDEVKPEKDKRLDAGRMVGYYGGSFVDRPTIGQTPMPSAQVINAEELALNITVRGDGFTGTPPSIKATITLINGSNRCEIISNSNLKYDPFNNIFTGRIALDTLDGSKYTLANNANSFESGNMGKPFKDWVYDTMALSYIIAPGANFDIEVKVTAVDTSGSSDPVNYLPQYLYWEDVNSLFASVEEDSVTGEPVTAHIAYGRHLQNLNKDISGVTDTITAAEQTRNIDFDATGVSAVYSWKETYKTPTEPQRKFKPIENNNLTSYNGAGLAISELLIEETGDNVGLFSSTDAKLDKIRLVNADVKGGNNVGALAGQYSGTAITNCGAYVDDVSKPAAVTGSAYDTYKVTGTGNYVGGLVGNITSAAALSQSFASVKVTGATDVGGLVGQVNSDSTFTDCYSGGHTVDGMYKSDANVTGTGTTGVGGLVGAVADGNTLTLAGTNYSTCSVKMDNTSLATLGLLVGGSTGSVTEDTAADVKTYATGEAFDSTGTIITTGLHNETAYLDTDRGTNTVSDFITVPYDETLKTSVYPYATNLNMHYGDWLEEASASSFCYYDVVNGTYGVWGYIVDPAGGTSTSVNTLASGTYATDDGYCVLVKVGDSAPTNVTVDGKPYTVEPIKDTSGATVTVENGGATYELHKITGLVADITGTGTGISLTNYYHSITVGTAEYWFNPFFACEIQKVPATGAIADAKPMEKPGAGGKDSTDPTDKYNEEVIIRTARQLANLAEQTGSEYITGSGLTDKQKAMQAAQNRSYVQLMNIDYVQYTGTDLTVGKSTGSRQSPAALRDGSYDGGKHFIRNLYIKEATGGTGLFGNTKGEMKNILLVNVKVDGSKEVGALAGHFHAGSTITNCGVYAENETDYNTFTVTGSGDSVGGLIGNADANAKLNGCFAAVKVNGQDEVGGLIGKLAVDKDTATTLTDCYSGGHTEGGDYKPDSEKRANVSGNTSSGKQIGGLIGYITTKNSGSVTLSGVNYSTCSVSGATPTPGSDIEIGLLVGAVETGASVTLDATTTPASVAYATGKAFDKDGNDLTPREEKDYLTTDLDTVKDNSITESNTHAYDDTLTGAYPYKSNLTAHYGDWVEKKKSVEACFYWAKEGSGYEVYIVGFGGTTQLTNSAGENHLGELCATHHTVDDAMDATKNATSNTDWGYGTIGLTGTLSGTGVSEITAPAADLTAALRAALKAYSFEDTDVKVYTGATADASTTVTSEIDNPVGGKYTYHLNLGFAAAISMTDGALGSSGIPYQIRNVRQLDNIPDNSLSSFQQTHDVYGKDYSGYVGASDFTGTYNGQSYRILELSITPPNTVKNAALFASVNGGTVENVILYSPSGSATITSTANGAANAAGIVGDLNGNATVHNCAVAGYTITVNNPSTSDSQCIGGIAGWVGSTAQITNCEAVVELVNNRASGGGVNSNKATGAFMGGIAGEVSSNGSVKLTNCYAGGTIKNEASTSAGGNPYISAGGIVGLHQGDNNLTVSYCYSYMEWGGDVGNQTGRYPIVNITNPFGTNYNAELSNTYYLQDGGLWNEDDSVTERNNLVDCMKDSNGNYFDGFGTADETHTFPSTSAPTGNYPYPAVVTDEDGKYVHYGDWPTP